MTEFGKRRLLTPLLVIVLAAVVSGCTRRAPKVVAAPAPQSAVRPFAFQIVSGSNQYHIEGFIARPDKPGRLPALLVLNGENGDAHHCIDSTRRFTAIGIQVACISIPGFGKSSGPSRFVGPQAVGAARRALDLLAARPDVDPQRLAVWGMADGAVAAGLLMDSDARPRAVILESGAYDLLKLWPEAPLRTKLRILRQVWPSKRLLKERSVVENLPGKLDCSVLILHGERDSKMPVGQAEQLAQALKDRGARVETHYFPQGAHDLGARVDGPLRVFLLDNLVAANPHAAS
ncbi:MAG TPA: prolyl oligopeptidase family serine peptidase [Candidatus Binataceae bacterium]|nr:prolyl oligopeptidase family serine peptidase [Candidatus Binataceae bacterium]